MLVEGAELVGSADSFGGVVEDEVPGLEGELVVAGLQWLVDLRVKLGHRVGPFEDVVLSVLELH